MAARLFKDMAKVFKRSWPCASTVPVGLGFIRKAREMTCIRKATKLYWSFFKGSKLLVQVFQSLLGGKGERTSSGIPDFSIHSFAESSS